MENGIVFFIGLLLVLFVCVLFKFKSSVSSKSFLSANTKGDIYFKRDKFFSAAEKNFFDVLNFIVGKDFNIFSKVRVADLLGVEKDGNGRINIGSLNKITSKHIDFVIVNKNNSSLVCGIELDDKSHNRLDRVKRDLFLNKIFKAAGLPLIRFKCRRTYSSVEIGNELMPYLKKNS